MATLADSPEVQAWLAEQPRMSEQAVQRCQRHLDRWTREERRHTDSVHEKETAQC